MFQVNDTVLYGGQSVCKITEISRQKVGKEFHRYYILKPVFDNKSTVYIPCENEALVSKMKPILSEKEVHELIETLHTQSLNGLKTMLSEKSSMVKLFIAETEKRLLR